METVRCSAEGATGKGFMIRANYTEIPTNTCLSRKTQFDLQNLQANLEIRKSETVCYDVIWTNASLILLGSQARWPLQFYKQDYYRRHVCLSVRYSFCTVELDDR